MDRQSSGSISTAQERLPRFIFIKRAATDSAPLTQAPNLVPGWMRYAISLRSMDSLLAPEREIPTRCAGRFLSPPFSRPWSLGASEIE